LETPLDVADPELQTCVVIPNQAERLTFYLNNLFTDLAYQLILYFEQRVVELQNTNSAALSPSLQTELSSSPPLLSSTSTSTSTSVSSTSPTKKERQKKETLPHNERSSSISDVGMSNNNRNVSNNKDRTSGNENVSGNAMMIQTSFVEERHSSTPTLSSPSSSSSSSSSLLSLSSPLIKTPLDDVAPPINIDTLRRRYSARKLKQIADYALLAGAVSDAYHLFVEHLIDSSFESLFILFFVLLKHTLKEREREREERLHINCYIHNSLCVYLLLITH
jgi:hypothetical protein